MTALTFESMRTQYRFGMDLAQSCQPRCKISLQNMHEATSLMGMGRQTIGDSQAMLRKRYIENTEEDRPLNN